MGFGSVRKEREENKQFPRELIRSQHDPKRHDLPSLGLCCYAYSTQISSGTKPTSFVAEDEVQ